MVPGFTSWLCLKFDLWCLLGNSLFGMLGGSCWCLSKEIQAAALCAFDIEPEGDQGFFLQFFCCVMSSLG